MARLNMNTGTLSALGAIKVSLPITLPRRSTLNPQLHASHTRTHHQKMRSFLTSSVFITEDVETTPFFFSLARDDPPMARSAWPRDREMSESVNRLIPPQPLGQ